MLNTDLDQLAGAPPDCSLESLETDVWRGVARRLDERRAFKGAVALQIVIMGVALAGGTWVGSHRIPDQEIAGLNVFSPYSPLAASTLLIGGQR